MVIFRVAGLFLLFKALVVNLSWTVWANDGQPHVAGSLRPIITISGEDVVLKRGGVVQAGPEPCRVIYRDHSELTGMTTASYHGRMALFTEELKHGNISLKIVEVTEADEGSYSATKPPGHVVMW